MCIYTYIYIYIYYVVIVDSNLQLLTFHNIKHYRNVQCEHNMDSCVQGLVSKFVREDRMPNVYIYIYTHIYYLHCHSDFPGGCTLCKHLHFYRCL